MPWATSPPRPGPGCGRMRALTPVARSWLCGSAWAIYGTIPSGPCERPSRQRAESAAATFREVFAGPLAAAREHVPEIVGEVEGGLGDIGTLAANAQDTAMAETVATETVFAITESALQAEAETAGASM